MRSMVKMKAPDSGYVWKIDKCIDKLFKIKRIKIFEDFFFLICSFRQTAFLTVFPYQ